MRFNRVLLIIPDISGYYGLPDNPHPGIGYLMGSLKSHNIDCLAVDMHFINKFNLLKQRIEEFNPDLIGVTIYTYRHKIVYELIKKIKKNFGIPIVIGGPHVSIYKDKSFHNGIIDYAIKNEGEKALVDLCCGVPFEEIGNLLYMRDGVIIENATLPFNTNLDALPLADYESLELKRYNSIGMVSSRGCPHQCIYCPVVSTMGRKFRPRSPDNILIEIKDWYNKGFRSFNFVDDTFLELPKRVLTLCDLIEQEGLTGLRLACDQGIRADKVTREILTRMRQVGFWSLGIGVESFNDRTLEYIKKDLSVNQIDYAVKTACELGFEVGLFFMVGFEGETPQDVQKSFAFAQNYPVAYANFYNIIPYPATKLFKEIKQNEGFLVLPDIYLNKVNTRIRKPVFALKSMSVSERQKLLKQGFDISRKISRNNTLKYYAHLGLAGQFLAWLLSARLFFHKKHRLKCYLQRVFSIFGKRLPAIGRLK